MATQPNEMKDVVAALWEATSPLAEKDAPAGLRERTFERLLEDHLAHTRTAGPIESNGIDGTTDRVESEAPDSSLVELEQRIDAVADRLRIDAAAVENIFDLTGERPKLAIHSSKLPSGNRAGQRQIALLICSAHAALGLETGSSDIRAAAEGLDLLDRNFMSNLAGFDEFAIRGKKGSPNRQVRLKGSGWEAVWRLVQELTADGG